MPFLFSPPQGVSDFKLSLGTSGNATPHFGSRGISAPGGLMPDRSAQINLAMGQQELSQSKKAFELQEQFFNALLGGGLFGGGFGAGSGNISSPGFPAGGVGQPGFPEGGVGGSFGGGSSNDLLSQISASGASARAQINQAAQSAQGSAMAALQQRGWAGSNLLPAEFANITREQGYALGNLESALLGQRIGVQENALDRQVQYSQIVGNILASLASSLG